MLNYNCEKDYYLFTFSSAALFGPKYGGITQNSLSLTSLGLKPRVWARVTHQGIVVNTWREKKSAGQVQHSIDEP
jgi:hypothetical protein